MVKRTVFCFLAAMDYVYAQNCGIFLTSTVYFVIYCAVRSNKPRVYSRAILPGKLKDILNQFVLLNTAAYFNYTGSHLSGLALDFIFFTKQFLLLFLHMIDFSHCFYLGLCILNKFILKQILSVLIQFAKLFHTTTPFLSKLPALLL